jgi:hypothetical protein
MIPTTSTLATPQSFTSIDALRQASDELIDSLPEDDSAISGEECASILQRIADFIEQVVAAGASFDVPADRRAAQAVIDFWVAKSYAVPPDGPTKPRLAGRASVLLKPFDSTTVTSAIKKGDALLASLREQDDKNKDTVRQILLRMVPSLGDKAADYKDLARRILLRIIRMSDTGRTYAAAVAARTQAAIASWAAKSYAMPPDGPTKPRLVGRASVLLKLFRSKLVETAKKIGEAALASFSGKYRSVVHEILLRMVPLLGDKNADDGEIARRILLRTVRMADSGRSYDSVAVNREDLLPLGNEERVNEVLNALVAANVLSATNGEPGEQISLRYDALTREWDTFNSWIDQRVSFRDAAMFWDRSARAKGALLPGGLADKALADYADLNALERAFIADSSSHSRRQMIAVFGLCAIVFVVFGFVLKGYYDNSMAEKREADAATAVIVAISTNDSRRKEESIRKLASYGKPLKFQTQFLHGLDLNGIYAGASSPAIAEFFKSAVLKVNLAGASLPFALFSQSEIQSVDFTNAELISARFDEAVITSTKFSGAKLYRAIFDRAQFREVDFSNTDLRSTSFRNVRIKGKLVFTGTAWWLALGWTLPQIEQLVTDYKDLKINEAKVFNNDVALRQKKVKEATVPEDRMQALNELAWTYAIYGTDLEIAKGHSEEALNEIKAIKGKSETWIANSSANFADTLAYIMLQQGRPEEAEKLLKPGIEISQDGESMFRYAVALHALASEKEGQDKEQLEQKAQAYLVNSLKDRNYVPSHELYLLRRYITDRFRDKMAALLKADAN